MNKKGFTVIEVLIVLVILGIIIGIVLPNTNKILNYSKIKEAETLEKALINSLKLYNEENENDIWCPILSNDQNACITEGDKYIEYNNLVKVNPSINLGSCLLKNNESLKIHKDHDGDYIYTVSIICSKDFENRNNKIASISDIDNKSIYYETED